ncbi:glycosyltransferase [Arthrobacter oryzae]|uniref:glycosyltransferase n=1 Tax=Arthrobacter oryzae TaxID=409290 RepID=UPI003594606D
MRELSKNPERPALSVVTITYNDPVGLARTLDSLLELYSSSNGQMEVLVQDGLSSGELGGLQQSYGDWVEFKSEADNGIYDAMNRGLIRTRGSYIWFLNGGDESTIKQWRDLAELLATDPGSMVLGAYWLDLGLSRVLRLPRRMSYIWHALPTSHQAILYPGDCARSTLYDTRYKVAGDYAFTAKMSQRCGVVTTQRPFATFRVGGTSYTHAEVIASEASHVQAHILQLGRVPRTISRILHLASRIRRRLLAKPQPERTS